MDPSGPALTFALALAAGVTAQSLAQHLRVPGIVLLLLAGVVLGPDVFDIVQPNTLGGGLEVVVGISVAVILFEGGLNLQIARLRREAATIRRLITLGAAVTTVGGMLAGHMFMGWSWDLALLFGTLVMVTGPTVITPLLRRVKVSRNLKTILTAEGVLIDPIGAIVAVVVFEAIVTATTASGAAVSLLGLPGRLLLGASIGVSGGLLIGFLLRRESLVPDELLNIFTLSLLIALYELSNAILPESGILAAPMAGMVVGNIQHRLKRELTEFKEQLTILLVGLLFVLLAADVRIAEVLALGWGGVFTVLALMLLVRPASVALCTTGSQLTWRERTFIGWLGPRGIVAAAVASLFGERLIELGVEEGLEMRALVFLVIAATVVIQGGLSPLVASMLGVRRPENLGYAVVGANPLGRLLGLLLQRVGEDVVVIDSNAGEARQAERAGLKVVYGNANEERTLARADVEARRGIICITPNDGINLLLSRRVAEVFNVSESLVALNRGGSVLPEQLSERGKRLLFGRQLEMQQWYHRLLHQAYQVEVWRYQGPAEEGLDMAEDRRAGHDSSVLPLIVLRDGTARPVDEQTRVQAGDHVYLVRPGTRGDAIADELQEAGWEFVESISELSSDGERRPGAGARDPRRTASSEAGR